MYIKVKVQDNGNCDGGAGLITAVDWAMRAEAGATANVTALNSSSGQGEIVALEVVSNTEAGGWSNTAFYASTSTYDFGGSWQADSHKTGRTFKKRFHINRKNTQTNYNNWAPFMSLYDADSATEVMAENYLTYTKSTSSSSNYGAWFNNSEPDEADWWHVSVTSKYVFFWSNHTKGVGFERICGVADLAGTPDHFLAAANDQFNSIGFYKSATGATSSAVGTGTTPYHWDFIAYHLTPDAGRQYNNYYLQSTGTYYTVNGTNPSNNSNIIPWRIGPHHYFNSVNTYTQMIPTRDSSGNKIGSLTPVILFNPFRGIPYQTMEGLYYYTDSALINTTEATAYQNQKHNDGKIVQDENGDNYMLIKQSQDCVTYAVRIE